MGQILHGSATTTEAVRRAIQNSQASLRELAARYGINPKTVAKWRRRTSVCDASMGPKEPHATILMATKPTAKAISGSVRCNPAGLSDTVRAHTALA